MALMAPARNKHRYQTCDDDDCPMPYCRIYKEGMAAGHAGGHSEGKAAGRAEGYADGYADAAGGGE